MTAHEYSAGTVWRDAVLRYSALGCVAVAAGLSSFVTANKDNWLIALIPAPSAVVLLWLSYTILWDLFIWRWRIVRWMHKVPVFEKRYWCMSRSSTTLKPRYCEITVKQTWTSMLICFQTPLMEGHSISAVAYPDASRVIAIFATTPRLVPFSLGNFRVASRYSQLTSGGQLRPVKNSTRLASRPGRLALIFSVPQHAEVDGTLVSET